MIKAHLKTIGFLTLLVATPATIIYMANPDTPQSQKVAGLVLLGILLYALLYYAFRWLGRQK